MKSKTEIKIIKEIIEGGLDKVEAKDHQNLIKQFPALFSMNEAKLNFDPTHIEEIKESHKALYLALKSTMPIEAEFTSEQKVDIYIELAKQFFSDEIGKTDQYKWAHNMAIAAQKVWENATPEDNVKCALKIQKAFQCGIKNRSLTTSDCMNKAKINNEFGPWIYNGWKFHEKNKEALKNASSFLLFNNLQSSNVVAQATRPEVVSNTTSDLPFTASSTNAPPTQGDPYAKLRNTQANSINQQFTASKGATREEIAAALVLKEIYTTEVAFFNQLASLNYALEDPSVLQKIRLLSNPEDRSTIDNYKKSLADFLNKYKISGFCPILILSPGEEKVEPLEGLGKLLEHQSAAQYLNDLSGLVTQTGPAQKIFSDNLELKAASPAIDGIAIENHFLTPFQRLLKYPLLMKELLKKIQNPVLKIDGSIINNASQLETKTKEIASFANTKQKEHLIQEAIGVPPAKDKLRVLRCISSMKLNFEKPDREIDYNRMLTATYPTLFKWDLIGNRIVVIAKNKVEIEAAVGLDKARDLNPEKFNLETLIQLYNKDKNPLWLVLASTKPIDDTFTRKQKIEIYGKLAKACLNGELGPYDKSTPALEALQAAVELAENHPECDKTLNDTFGPTTKNKKLIDSPIISKLIEKGKLRKDNIIYQKLHDVSARTQNTYTENPAEDNDSAYESRTPSPVSMTPESANTPINENPTPPQPQMMDVNAAKSTGPDSNGPIVEPTEATGTPQSSKTHETTSNAAYAEINTDTIIPASVETPTADAPVVSPQTQEIQTAPVSPSTFAAPLHTETPAVPNSPVTTNDHIGDIMSYDDLSSLYVYIDPQTLIHNQEKFIADNLNTKKCPENEKNTIEILYILNELYSTEVGFFKDLIKLSDALNMPEVLKQIEKLSNPADRKAINDYKNALTDFILEDYKTQSFFSNLTTSNSQEQNKVINGLNGLSQYQNTQAYTDRITRLVVQGSAITKIIENNPKLQKSMPLIERSEVKDYLLKPMQRIGKYPLLLTGMLKAISKHPNLENYLENMHAIKKQVSQATSTTNNFIGLIDDANKEIQQAMGKSKSKDKLSVLRCVTLLNPELEQQKTGFNYNSILTTTFPEIFKLNKDGNITVSSKNDKLLISQALGINQDGVIDPNQFNSTKLIELYDKDKNPLWLVLASRQPIDENFTRVNKVAIYGKLITAYQNKELGTLDTFHIKIASRAMEIAKGHPECDQALNEVFPDDHGIDALILSQNKFIADNLNTKKCPENEKNTIEILYILNELYSTEVGFFKDLIKLSDALNMPEVLKQIEKLSNPADRKAINDYKNALTDFILEDYKTQSFFSNLTTSNSQEQNKVINGLNGLSQYQNTQAYTDRITRLVVQGSAITKIIENNPKLQKSMPLIERSEVKDYLLKPMQRIGKYPLLLTGMLKAISKHPNLENYLENMHAIKKQVSQATSTTNNFIGLIDDANKEIQQAMGKSKSKDKLSVLRCVTLLNPELEQQKTGFNYNSILTTTFPEIFKLNKDGNITVSSKNDKLLISQALGINQDGVIDPNQFNSTKLIELYDKDKNPLWLVLASRQPIDENFTRVNKVAIYGKLITAYQNKELGTLDTFHIKIASRAMEIAKGHPECDQALNEVFPDDHGKNAKPPTTASAPSENSSNNTHQSHRDKIIAEINRLNKEAHNFITKHIFGFGDPKEKAKKIQEALNQVNANDDPLKSVEVVTALAHHRSSYKENTLNSEGQIDLKYATKSYKNVMSETREDHASTKKPDHSNSNDSDDIKLKK